MENKYYNRKNGKVYIVKEDKSTIFLYRTWLGRLFLKILYLPFISKMVGLFMDSFLSRLMIKRFIRSNMIDMSDYRDEKYKCFNEFFTRKIIPDRRKIDFDKNSLVSPADSKLSVYKISEKNEFKIKNSLYKLEDLVPSDVSANFKDGYALIFRLGVDDYHHYIYIDDGVQDENNFIKGKLHTVRPIAVGSQDVFVQNQREWTVLHTKNFGDVIEIEVGAVCVGKIVNLKENNKFKKGEEKGYFKFGGSTVILLVNNVIIDEDIIKNSLENAETKVLMGEKIGVKKQ